MKAALAGLAFVAGCEIGIAIQLVKMVHKFTIRENAINDTPAANVYYLKDSSGR